MLGKKNLKIVTLDMQLIQVLFLPAISWQEKQNLVTLCELSRDQNAMELLLTLFKYNKMAGEFCLITFLNGFKPNKKKSEIGWGKREIEVARNNQ